MGRYELYFSLRSPFARRVRLALARLNEPFEERVVDVMKPPRDLFEANPLGLVPVLKTREGIWLEDSAAILEYLQETHGGIWPKSQLERVRARAFSGYAEGIMTASVAHYLERVQKEHASPAVLEEHRETMERALARLASEPKTAEPWIDERGELGQPTWDLAVALQYVDLRNPEIDWRKAHPGLQEILNKCSESEGFRKTSPPPA